MSMGSSYGGASNGGVYGAAFGGGYNGGGASMSGYEGGGEVVPALEEVTLVVAVMVIVRVAALAQAPWEPTMTMTVPFGLCLYVLNYALWVGDVGAMHFRLILLSYSALKCLIVLV
jgi:hypothetical protein